VEGFNLRKLSDLEVRKQYQIEISNRFAALENLIESKDINTAWENINENIKTSAKDSIGLCELKRQKPWFGEECSRFFNQKKQATRQLLHDAKQSNVHSLNNVTCEATTHFRKKNNI